MGGIIPFTELIITSREREEVGREEKGREGKRRIGKRRGHVGLSGLEQDGVSLGRIG